MLLIDVGVVCFQSAIYRFFLTLCWFVQMLNKEHEKAEDSKPVALPPVAGS